MNKSLGKGVKKDGFNRYMVECEYRGFLKEKYLALSFNRYMVECE